MSELAFPMSRECPLDPPAELGRIREAGGITRVRLWDGSTPWLVTRYADVRAVLADPRFSSDPSRPAFPASRATSRRPRSFIRMDGADHARQRKALISDFTMRRIESLRPLVVETVDKLLSAMASPPVDLVESYALPLPSLVICHLLGVPYADHDFFQRASRAMLDTVSTSGDARRELVGYLADLVERKRAEPADDLISKLVANDELSRRDVVSMSVLLLIAGHETTANMIALGTLTLLQNPSQADELRAGADPSTAAEELLRLLTVVHLGRRGWRPRTYGSGMF
jgi:cytochrome P450